MMYHGFGGLGWIGMLIGFVITVAFLVGLVVLVVWAVRRSNSGSANHIVQNSGSSSAKDIAQARYAKGEITRDEYQQILSDLNQ